MPWPGINSYPENFTEPGLPSASLRLCAKFRSRKGAEKKLCVSATLREIQVSQSGGEKYLASLRETWSRKQNLAPLRLCVKFRSRKGAEKKRCSSAALREIQV